MLAAWNGRENPDYRGAVLLRAFWENALLLSGGPWSHPFRAASPVATPYGLATVRAGLQAAFGTVPVTLKSAHLPYDVTPRHRASRAPATSGSSPGRPVTPARGAQPGRVRGSPNRGTALSSKRDGMARNSWGHAGCRVDRQPLDTGPDFQTNVTGRTVELMFVWVYFCGVLIRLV